MDLWTPGNKHRTKKAARLNLAALACKKKIIFSYLQRP